MKNWIRKQFRKKPRVFILPTKMGGYLNGLIFLMFLLSVGYSNNLLLIFTLFLFAFNLLWLIQTHFHLYRFKVTDISVASAHAGENALVRIRWQQAPKGPWDWEFVLEGHDGTYSCTKGQDFESSCAAEVKFSKRGVIKWEFLKVMSTRPFGLYRTWIYFPLSSQSFAYPPLHQLNTLNLSGMDMEGEVSTGNSGHDDFLGLNSYLNNESRKISWKHYARSGELLIKDGEEKKSPALELELNTNISPEQKEFYLSQLASELVECHRRDVPFSLRVNGINYHKLEDCLRELAIC